MLAGEQEIKALTFELRDKQMIDFINRVRCFNIIAWLKFEFFKKFKFLFKTVRN